MDEKKKMRMVVEEVGSEQPLTTENNEKESEGAVSEEIKDTPSVEVKEVKKDIVERQDNSKPAKESSFNILWILIPGMLLLGLLIGGIFAYVFGLQKISKPAIETIPQNQEIVTEPSASPSASPKATPSADLSKYKIKILNGSGIKGEAGKVETLLKDAGFVILSTGNASTYDYTKTQITLKTGIDPDFVIALTDTLSNNYQLTEPKTVSSQTNDVTITVGSLKEE